MTDDQRMAATRLRPIQPRGLGDEIAKVIREGIVQGRFRRGERLVETKLAAELGVSRGPVREALRVLVGEGFLLAAPGHGTRVIAMSTADVIEIYEARAAVESYCARLLATRLTPRTVRDLEARRAAIEGAAAGRDDSSVWAANSDFHEAICRLAGNRRLYAFFHSQMQILRALFLSEGFPHDRADQTVVSHGELLARILQGDPDGAAAAAMEHAEAARLSVVAFLEGQPV